MKNLILTGLMVLGCSQAFAEDLTMQDMQALLPNMERSGTEGSSYKCKVKTEWLVNGDLKVVATTQYKDWEPSTMEIVFTTAKNVDVYSEDYAPTTVYTFAQSTVLKEEDDYRVDLYESFSFDIKNSEIVAFDIQIAEVDHESDPHEDSIHCALSK